MILVMAWRNIWRNRTRSFVVMTSLILGLMAGIFILGLYQGMLDSRVRTVIDSEVAHIQIHEPDFKTDFEARYTLPLNIDSIIATFPQVSKSAQRTIANGMLMTTTGSAGIRAIGIDRENETIVSGLADKIITGNFLGNPKKNQVLIGKKLADKMKLNPGSKLVLTFTSTDNEIVSGAFRITGIYQTINAPLDERLIYLSRTELNRLLGISTDQYHEIAIILKKDNLLDESKVAFATRFPNLKIETWKEISPETRLMIETTDTYSVIFIVIIMLALMFGIINTMLMAVLERTRELGMLVAVGMNRLRLFGLVLLETVLLTLAGFPFAMVLAYFVIAYFNKNGIDISSFAGEAMSGFGFSSWIYPEFPWANLLMVLNIVFITALVSALFPSYQVLKLKPVEAMRH